MTQHGDRHEAFKFTELSSRQGENAASLQRSHTPNREIVR